MPRNASITTFLSNEIRVKVFNNMSDNRIKIQTENISISCVLNETESAKTVFGHLPIEGTVNTWGDEIYFSTAISLDNEENASDVVESGSLAYWPPGNAICIFFGRTPASIGDEPRAASPVNILGSIDGDEKIFRSVKSGSPIRLEVE